MTKILLKLTALCPFAESVAKPHKWGDEADPGSDPKVALLIWEAVPTLSDVLRFTRRLETFAEASFYLNHGLPYVPGTREAGH